MNYIDKIADKIGEKCDCKFTWAEKGTIIDPDGYNELLRLYAVLCLIKGVETTMKDVHDAWSAWTSPTDPNHRSLVPFDELTKKVQDYDQPYVDAIRAVAKANDIV